MANIIRAWTKEELKNLLAAQNDRQKLRLLIKEHGRPKVEAMSTYLQNGGELVDAPISSVSAPEPMSDQEWREMLLEKNWTPQLLAERWSLERRRVYGIQVTTERWPRKVFYDDALKGLPFLEDQNDSSLVHVPRLLPEEFIALWQAKNWTDELLAIRWKVKLRRIEQIAEDPLRSIYYDDALRSLPVLTDMDKQTAGFVKPSKPRKVDGVVLLMGQNMVVNDYPVGTAIALEVGTRRWKGYIISAKGKTEIADSEFYSNKTMALKAAHEARNRLGLPKPE
ncbi:hypothetical protein ACYPKM_02465 [Pseudomonas aeruginosa]